MKVFLAATALLLSTIAARADEVSDTLESALAAYNEGDIQYALEELEYAKQLIAAMKTDALSAFLPAAPDGWTREVNSEMNAGLAFMGGGIGAEADYSRDGQTFSITIMADNPMIAAFAGMIGNAGMMGAKLERVGRMKYMNQDGELSGLVDNRILIQAKGAPVDVMIPVLKAIDVKALEDFGG
ncbi:hypothetical protein [Aliiroseovarius sp.]|uniref:hypothetical protein n=1 Tax=Aliiroseovarius sp. TaxID=1872442 RepID=UPI0026145DAE|nr:hypothetical protein [Aliiroseovarius sp.]